MTTCRDWVESSASIASIWISTARATSSSGHSPGYKQPGHPGHARRGGRAVAVVLLGVGLVPQLFGQDASVLLIGQAGGTALFQQIGGRGRGARAQLAVGGVDLLVGRHGRHEVRSGGHAARPDLFGRRRRTSGQYHQRQPCGQQSKLPLDFAQRAHLPSGRNVAPAHCRFYCTPNRQVLSTFTQTSQFCCARHTKRKEWGGLALSGPAGRGYGALFLLRSPVNVALSGPAGHGCGALFLLRGSPPACKKQTAAPAPLRLSRPLDAPQLRSPVNVGGCNL